MLNAITTSIRLHREQEARAENPSDRAVYGVALATLLALGGYLAYQTFTREEPSHGVYGNYRWTITKSGSDYVWQIFDLNHVVRASGTAPSTGIALDMIAAELVKLGA